MIVKNGGPGLLPRVLHWRRGDIMDLLIAQARAEGEDFKEGLGETRLYFISVDEEIVGAQLITQAIRPSASASEAE